MSATEHELLVDFANSLDSRHWNSSSLEAMKRQVAPMAWSIDLGTFWMRAR
jgi:hypothetical protein